MGLVNRVVPNDQLEAEARTLAETIAANAPLTVNSVKFIVGEVLKPDAERDLAQCAKLVQACFASRDKRSDASGTEIAAFVFNASVSP